jgi:hypothetical protein
MGSSSSHCVEGGRSATHAQDVKLDMLPVAVGGVHEQRIERIERATIFSRWVQQPRLLSMGDSRDTWSSLGTEQISMMTYTL